MPDELAMARTALLDAIDALQAHLNAIIVVGAQVIYLHTGLAEVAIAESVTLLARDLLDALHLSPG